MSRTPEGGVGGGLVRWGRAGPDDPLRSAPGCRILVIGFGNPGRRDDGLGPALAARLASLGLPGVTTESDYQLSIEHAELAARHDLVVFADAARDVVAGTTFYLRPVAPSPGTPCFSHRVSPQAVLQLAADCFAACPGGWVLGIQPEDLESFAEGLTPTAETNLASALEALRAAIENGWLQCGASGGSNRPGPG